MANYNGNSNKFVDTLPDPSVVPSSNGVIATDPTEVPEIEQAIVDGYKDEIAIKLARHSLFTDKTFNSLKARLDFMESEHYLIKIGEINKTRTLIDNDFSKNHTMIKTNEVNISLKENPIIIATVDDNKQDRFKLRKVGVI